jgi:hypothetical protein
VEDADYVVLGQWEEHYFDDMWHSAQDSNKPTVTPAFVMDSYEKGSLMDPNDYPTEGPMKLRKDGPKRSKRRPVTGGRKKRGGASFSAPPSAPSGEAPKWLRFFKEAERVRSLQRIGAMFQKNARLTYDVLATRLHNQVRRFELNTAHC